MEKILELLAVVISAYIIGSIPTGYIIVKAFTGQDIRTMGSGPTGATNVKRVMGKKWFFITLLLDAFKGALPVVLAAMFAKSFTGIGLLPVLAAIAVILGHSRSIFLKFTGGKSAALPLLPAGRRGNRIDHDRPLPDRRPETVYS